MCLFLILVSPNHFSLEWHFIIYNIFVILLNNYLPCGFIGECWMLCHFKTLSIFTLANDIHLTKFRICEYNIYSFQGPNILLHYAFVLFFHVKYLSMYYILSFKMFKTFSITVIFLSLSLQLFPYILYFLWHF